MSIFERKNAKEYSYDFFVGGIRFAGNTGAANQREAKREEDRLKAAARKDMESRRPQSDMTFEAMALLWMEQVGQHHKNALTSLRDVERLIDRVDAKMLSSQIGNDLVAQVVAKRRMDGRDVGNGEREHGLVSNATVNRSTTELLKKNPAPRQQGLKMSRSGHRLVGAPTKGAQGARARGQRSGRTPALLAVE